MLSYGLYFTLEQLQSFKSGLDNALIYVQENVINFKVQYIGFPEEITLVNLTFTQIEGREEIVNIPEWVNNNLSGFIRLELDKGTNIPYLVIEGKTNIPPSLFLATQS